MEPLVCHDCKQSIGNNTEYMPYDIQGKKYAKCKPCHKSDPLLRNYRQTEVYSRVVGYIRPVGQWNKGKQEEYKDRQEYSVENC